MDPWPQARLVRALQFLSRAASVAVILVGSLVLAGWIFRLEHLRDILPGYGTIKANSALSLILLGVSLWLARKTDRQARRIAQACASLAALVGLLTLWEYLFGWDGGIDQLLVRDVSGDVGSWRPGRMGPNTALNLVLLGLALLAGDRETRRGYRPAELLTLGAAVIAFLALIGYAFGEELFYGVGSYTRMALEAALTFGLLCLGILWARPDRGLMGILTSDAPGGLLARRLLFAALAVPSLLAWLERLGQRAGFYDAAFGLSALVASNIVIFAALIWWSAASLNRADAERRRADQALRESQESFRLLVEGVEDYAVFMLDPAGHVVTWNSGAERIMGYRAEEILNQHFSRFFLTDDIIRGKPEQELKIATLKGRCQDEDWRLRKDGSQFWANTVITALRDEAGNLRGFAKVTRDVTERRRTQEALRASEAQYRLLFERNPLPMWVYDVETLLVVAVNDAAVRHYGYSREEFRAMSIKDLGPADTAFVERAPRRGTGLDVAHTWKHWKKNGTLIEVEMASHDITFTGKPARLALANDVTELKKAEEALRASEERYRELFENANDLVYTLDLEGHVTSFNKACEKVTGYTGEDAAGRKLLEVIAPEYRELTLQMLARKLTGQPSTTYVVEIIAKDGRRVPLEVSTRLILLKGKPVGVQGIARDITERIKAEESLRQLSGRLLQLQDDERRRIARELHDSTGQHLAALAMNLAMVEDAASKLDPPARKTLAESLALAEQCASQIRTLSYLLHPPLLEEMGLSSALEMLAKGFTKRTGIQVEVEAPSQLGRLPREVETALFRIVQESLANIHRHSRSPSAKIRLATDSGHISLEVSDPGPSRYLEFSDDASEGIAELGVGVAGMQERARQLGGWLDFRSGDQGTTVQAVLPLPSMRPETTAHP